MKTHLIALTLAAATFAPAAFAGEDMTLAKLDTDKTGTLTLAEVHAAKPAVTAEIFAKHDTDADGVLSAAEFDAWKAAKAETPAKEPAKTEN